MGHLRPVLPCCMLTLPRLLVCICSAFRHGPAGLGLGALVMPGPAVTADLLLLMLGLQGGVGTLHHILPCRVSMLPMLPMCICCTVVLQATQAGSCHEMLYTGRCSVLASHCSPKPPAVRLKARRQGATPAGAPFTTVLLTGAGANKLVLLNCQLRHAAAPAGPAKSLRAP